jgi:DNA repair protein RadC
MRDDTDYALETDPSFAFILTQLIREVPREEMPLLGNSRDVYEFSQTRLFSPNDREHFWVLLLDGKHRVIAANHISTGTLSAALVHPREVFKPAIAIGAAAVILIHNHPSGDPTPSPEDIEITTRLSDTGRLIGIHVLDHIIAGDGSFTSCFERGLLQHSG